MDLDTIAVVELVTGAFDEIGIPYAVGGSFASSAHGFPRTTNDADFIADVRPSHVDAIHNALAGEFYLDRGAMAEAIRLEGSFNLIHYETAFKVDVFVRGHNEFRAAQIARGAKQPDSGHGLRIISPEDTILAKLLWYREGGEVSQRQWRDVQEVMQAQSTRLDTVYLNQAAGMMGLTDLLARAIEGLAE